MKEKTTPGPWYEASTGNHQRLIISEVDGSNVAVVYDNKDAAIIAAAPDLLRVCKELFSYLQFQEPETAATRAMFNLSRQVLACAERRGTNDR